MLDLENIQEQAVTMIQDITYLDGVTVLTDNGEQNDAAEKARRETGAVIIVRKPDSLQVQVTAGGRTFGQAQIQVLLSVNKEVNDYSDSGLGLDLERAVREIKSALEAYDATHGSQYFVLASDQMLQVEGLYERQIGFSAWVTG